MSTLYPMIVAHLISQSLHLTILIAVVAVLTWLLRTCSAHIRYLLWLVVLAKCLVFPVFHVDMPVMKPAQMLVVAPAVIEADVADGSKEVILVPMPVSESVSKITTDRMASRPDYHIWAGVIWLAGCLLFLVLAFIKSICIGLTLKRKRQPLACKQQDEINQLVHTLAYKRSPKVWQVDDLSQPFVWGLPKGSIYVPSSIWTYSQTHRRCALTHELNHIMRWDASVNFLQILAQAVFWFHPLVWWANLKLRHEREKCCDEAAIAMLDTPSEQYGQAIVETLAVARQIRTHKIQSSLAIAGPLKSIEERLRSIMKPNKQFHKRASLLNVICITLIALAVVPTAWRPTQVKADEVTETPKKPFSVKPGEVLFEAQIYEVDQSFLESKKIESIDVRVDLDYARQLADLAKTGRQVKRLAAPRATIIDGEQAIITFSEEMKIGVPNSDANGVPDFMSFEQGGTTVLGGTIRPGNQHILLTIETRQSNVQMTNRPMLASSGVKTYIEVSNRQPVVISGYADGNPGPGRKMVAVITPTFTGKANITQAALAPTEQKVELPKQEQMQLFTPVFYMGAVERLEKRTAFIQNDPMVKALTEKVVDLELKLMEYSLKQDSNHPNIQSTQRMLTTIQRRLEEQKYRIGMEFDEAVKEEIQARSMK